MIRRILLAALSGFVFAAAAGPCATAAEPLQFRIREGGVENAFYQNGPVAAHLLLSSGQHPRILVAFPAGNSGTGIWFDPTSSAVSWTLEGLHPATGADSKGRPLHGIEADLVLAAATPLRIKDAVLGSIRVLRDYQLDQPYPRETAARAKREGNTLTWSRDRLDGAPGYEIALTAESGRFVAVAESWSLTPDTAGKPLRLHLRALTGEKPLTPFAADVLFSRNAGTDERTRNALRFLSYEEKFLAGSWRFDTYFGRDTLMSLRLLMPALQPQAVEDGLAAVLERLGPQGQVAHEEDIGEFAVLRHRREKTGTGDTPIYDYKMIDGDVMLAPVVAAYLLDNAATPAQGRTFLARKLDSGETVGAALARNFKLVLDQSHAFARDPVAKNLIALRAGQSVGEWRDSEDGLAGGRIPYDVNAILMPAALDAIARLQQAGLTKADSGAAESPAELARIWARQAPPLFRLALPAATARAEVGKYAKSQGIDATAALASLPNEGDVVFNALSLDARGKPIPVIHSDDGFALLFGHPDAAQLHVALTAMFRPFPAGLMTDVGMVVANPAYASGDIQSRFGRNAYHGTVVWSWQQALMAAGLARQLLRNDLPEVVTAELKRAQQQLWQVIQSAQSLRTSELWSWNYANGRYVMNPFGQGKGDKDESNAAQLWSTVYLAIPPPAAVR